MKVSEFFSDHFAKLLLKMVFAAATAFLLLVTGTQPGIIVILGIIWSLIFVGGQAVNFFRYRSRFRELEEIMEGLDKKYLFAECVRTGKTIYERRLFELFRRAGRSMISAVSDAEASKKEYREYVESFVHEVKTPITAANLICRRVDEKNRGKLSYELAQIGAHVERVLFYARAENTQRDFLIREESLRGLVTQALGEYKTFLIASGVRVEIKELEQIVFTDRKWTVFLLGQLLQNSVRYRRGEPVVVIEAERVTGEVRVEGDFCGMGSAFQKDGGVLSREKSSSDKAPRLLKNSVSVCPQTFAGSSLVRLIVRDNGIGIPAHELPRVFERGFTGSNGRARGGSTGMGLYLCRRLADSLGIGLEIISECGVGTSVVLTFAAKKEIGGKII